jgi:hypothetical protein
MVFDVPPASLMQDRLLRILADSARELETLVVLPFSVAKRYAAEGSHVVPLIAPADRAGLPAFSGKPLMVELASWDEELFEDVRHHIPAALPCLRVDFAPGIEKQIPGYVTAGVRVFHFVADYHGRGADGDFVLNLIRRVHQALVAVGRRDQVTFIGGGGIVAAEHVPKAIICGLDLVSLETPLLVALQVAMKGPCVDRSGSQFHMHGVENTWGVQRLKNLVASWRDQLLEVMGAMGLREVRRLRGEMGRAMFQKDLEREAFEGITGYE